MRNATQLDLWVWSVLKFGIIQLGPHDQYSRLCYPTNRGIVQYQLIYLTTPPRYISLFLVGIVQYMNIASVRKMC